LQRAMREKMTGKVVKFECMKERFCLMSYKTLEITEN
jgi:hypothetical protein